MQKLSDKDLVGSLRVSCDCTICDRKEAELISRLAKGRKAVLAMEKIDSATDAMEDTYKDRILVIKNIITDYEKELK